MATISNTPRPGYVWDATDNCWYPIGTGPHSHADYITAGSAINPNIVDAKGDIIAATAADTVARLAVGSNDQVLTADSSTATGLKWATPAAGGMTLLSTTTLSGSTTTISSIPTTYNRLIAFIYGVNPSANSQLTCYPNGGGATNSLTNESELLQSLSNTSLRISPNTGASWTMKSADTSNYFTLIIDNYASSTNRKGFMSYGIFVKADGGERSSFSTGGIGTNSQITSLLFQMDSGTFSGGTIQLYGAK